LEHAPSWFHKRAKYEAALARLRADTLPTTAQSTPAAPSTLDVGGEDWDAYDVVLGVLKRYALPAEDGGTRGLADALTPDGETSIQTGLEELEMLADDIAHDVAAALRARPPGSAPGGESEPVGYAVQLRHHESSIWIFSRQYDNREAADFAASVALPGLYAEARVVALVPVGRAPAEQQGER
jgi:hypothetical protein